MDIQEQCINTLVGRQAGLIDECLKTDLHEKQPHLPLDRISTLFRHLKAPPGQLPHTHTVQATLPVLSSCLKKWPKEGSKSVFPFT